MMMGRRDGFTLIEVLGALVIFSVGVLAAMNLSDGMGQRLVRAGIRSELTTLARTRLDSLQAEGYDALTPTSREETVQVRGRPYQERWSVARFSPLVLELVVSYEPSGSSPGPRYEVTSYVAGRWYP